jgi:hypothetical protein
MPCNINCDSAVQCLHCEAVDSAADIIEAIIHINGHLNNGWITTGVQDKLIPLLTCTACHYDVGAHRYCIANQSFQARYMFL